MISDFMRKHKMFKNILRSKKVIFYHILRILTLIFIPFWLQESPSLPFYSNFLHMLPSLFIQKSIFLTFSFFIFISIFIFFLNYYIEVQQTRYNFEVNCPSLSRYPFEILTFLYPFDDFFFEAKS